MVRRRTYARPESSVCWRTYESALCSLTIAGQCTREFQKVKLPKCNSTLAARDITIGRQRGLDGSTEAIHG
jgi:hypothetical protein